MKKKMTALGLTVCLAATTVLVGGCGTKEEKASTEEKTVVQFSYPAYGYDSDKEQAFWDEAIAEFEDENPSIDV